MTALRGEVSTGLAEIKGELALLRQSDSQTGQTLAAHSAQLAEHDQRIAELRQAQAAEAEVRRVDHRRLQAAAAVVGIVAAAAAVVPIVR
ncbi:hypothetical protein ACFV1L_18340 [Kitasatospora sp. NPDC059646]|uniref:hypothetical protein n=1 Tax=Kitasatospora sp. NPDC059646 TaxID=3346893 RepID=UPI00369677D9